MESLIIKTNIKFWLILISTRVLLAGQIIDNYHSAVANNQGYKAQQQYYTVASEQHKIAKSNLLPNLSATAMVSKLHLDIPGEDFRENINNNDIGVKLNQPVFDLKVWHSLQQSSANEDLAKTQLKIAESNLMLNLASKYIDVLKMYAIFEANRSQVRQLKLQQKYDLARFKVGTITKTTLLETEAQYDLAIAEEMANKNNLVDAVNDFTAVSWQYNPVFFTLKDNFSLDKKQQGLFSLEQLLEKNNLNIKAAAVNTEIAKYDIKIATANLLPTVNAFGLYNKQHFSEEVLGSFDLNSVKTKQVGLQFNMPLFYGGGLIANRSKAKYKYNAVLSDYEQLKSDISINLKTIYHHLITGSAQIKAFKRAVSSARSSVKSHREGYKAGTQTNLELLASISQLRDAQSNYAIARFDYIKNTLVMKNLTGSLEESDLARLDEMFTEKITMPK